MLLSMHPNSDGLFHMTAALRLKLIQSLQFLEQIELQTVSQIKVEFLAFILTLKNLFQKVILESST